MVWPCQDGEQLFGALVVVARKRGAALDRARTLAEDALQEIAVRLCRCPSATRADPRHYRNWCLRVGANWISDQFRREFRQRTRSFADDEDFPDRGNGECDPPTADLVAALARLPAADRQPESRPRPPTDPLHRPGLDVLGGNPASLELARRRLPLPYRVRPIASATLRHSTISWRNAVGVRA